MTPKYAQAEAARDGIPTLCRCGHARSQHHIREEGGLKVCDYAGHSCNCTGYDRRKNEPRAADEMPERDFYEGDSPDY